MLRKIINIEYFIHSVKTLIACCIGILLTFIISFPSDQWIVITIIVVMCSQLFVGSVVQKSYLRFFGTLMGCIFAVIALVSMGDNRLAVAGAVGLSSFIFSYISVKWENLSYACTLGAVTTAIIMLGQTPTVTFAAERFLEIAIGLLIAALVSQFILPINARDHLRRAQVDTLGKMKNYYVLSLVNFTNPTENLNYLEMDEDIVKTLLKQRQLAVESKREPMGAPFNQARFLQKIYCEKEMIRAITFMHIAYQKILNSTPGFVKLPSLINFNEMTIGAFDTIIHTLDSRKQNVSINIPHITQLAADCQQSVNNQDDLLYMEGFLYCAEILSKSLEKLSSLAGCLEKNN